MSDLSVPSWDSITERTWAPPPRRRFLGRFLGPRTRIRRVRPFDAEYREVVALRYRGFVETGFVDPARTGESAMRLARDEDSIILGLFRRDRLLLATMTLNTITPRFPGMAMELDKKVRINHAHFRDPAVLEITKLVIDRGIRGRRMALGMLYVSSLIARILGKHHLWQVSRDVPSDVSWRVGLGFDYSVGTRFIDPDLNDMPSRVGYLYLPSVMENPRVPSFIKAIYEDALGTACLPAPAAAALAAAGQDGCRRKRRAGTPRPHPLMVPLVRRILIPLLVRRYRLSAHGLSALERVAPPYIVVANHVSFWDPFWVNSFIRHPIQFVASDNLFRTFPLGFAMRLLGAIPKTKLMNDPETVRHIYRVLAGGGVVGLFPEGSRTNDGRLSPLVPAVARLLRRLKVPVIAARDGGRVPVAVPAGHGMRGGARWRSPTRKSSRAMRSRASPNRRCWRSCPARWTTTTTPGRERAACGFVPAARPSTWSVSSSSARTARSVSRIVSLDDRVRCTVLRILGARERARLL